MMAYLTQRTLKEHSLHLQSAPTAQDTLHFTILGLQIISQSFTSTRTFEAGCIQYQPVCQTKQSTQEHLIALHGNMVCCSAEALYVQRELLFNNNHTICSAAAQSGCALHRGSDALPNIVECDTGPHSSTNSPENITKAAPLQCCTDCEQWSGSPLGGLGGG